MSPCRPDRLVLVAGTATEVGKTWFACGLANELRGAGVSVSARKPTQSYDPSERSPTDSELLGGATGESASEVCPPEFTYPLAMAPPMAAAELGLSPPTMSDLVSKMSWPDGVRVGVVETAGGVRSPLSIDGDSADLAKLLGPDRVVLVASAGLGAINAVRSAACHLADWPLTVFLNRYRPDERLHVLNRAWLVERDRLDVEFDLARVTATILVA
jgi:dethiobiotin synthetase